MVAAKADIRELLQETKLITHKTLTMVKENEGAMKEIEEILKKDKRYLELDHIPEERQELVMGYLEDLEKRGPPPPPTASEPSRRSTKLEDEDPGEIPAPPSMDIFHFSS
uniref:FF domain-containing protein n=5 Tax=Homalodisca TaxID=139475 RepID=A0A1B6IB56_9HEMI